MAKYCVNCGKKLTRLNTPISESFETAIICNKCFQIKKGEKPSSNEAVLKGVILTVLSFACVIGIMSAYESISPEAANRNKEKSTIIQPHNNTLIDSDKESRGNLVVCSGNTFAFGENNSDCSIGVLDLYSITWKKADRLLGKPIEVERSGEIYIRKYKPCQSFRYVELYFHKNGVIAVTVILSKSVKSMAKAKQVMGLINIGPPDQSFPAGARWHHHNMFEISIYNGPPINAFILFISHSQWDDLNS